MKKNIVRALAGLFPRCFWLLFDPYQKPVERIIRKKEQKSSCARQERIHSGLGWDSIKDEEGITRPEKKIRHEPIEASVVLITHGVRNVSPKDQW